MPWQEVLCNPVALAGQLSGPVASAGLAVQCCRLDRTYCISLQLCQDLLCNSVALVGFTAYPCCLGRAHCLTLTWSLACCDPVSANKQWVTLCYIVLLKPELHRV